jgi:ParB family transcriptional regulator, chromosome partitioning protein
MIRRPLGRGLDALINNSQPAPGTEQHNDSSGTSTPGTSSQFLMVDPQRIAAGRFQPRRYFEPEALDELVNAIKSQGVVEPLIVRTVKDGNYELIAGERRLRASRLAALEQVPVIVRELDDRSALEMSLVENLLRENLNPTEEGSAFARLNREFALTHDEIARRIGKSRAYVTNMIRLMELPLPILEMVGKGELTAGQVRPLLMLGSADEQLQEAQRIVEGGLTARNVEELAARRREPRRNDNVNVAPIDPNLKALAESLQRALKRKVQITRRRGRRPGHIELEYYNDDDLTTLAQRLSQ